MVAGFVQSISISAEIDLLSLVATELYIFVTFETFVTIDSVAGNMGIAWVCQHSGNYYDPVMHQTLIVSNLFWKGGWHNSHWFSFYIFELQFKFDFYVIIYRNVDQLHVHSNPSLFSGRWKLKHCYVGQFLLILVNWHKIRF